MPSAFLKRLATAVVGIPLAAAIVLWPSPWPFRALVAALAGTAAWELGRMFHAAGRPFLVRLGVTATVAVTAAFLVPGGPVLALAAAVVVILSAPLWAPAPPAVEPVASTLLAVVYIGWLLGHALVLHARPEGPALVLFVAGVTWAGETGAYLAGSFFGRHPLAPVVSPRKTVEGAVAQAAVSLAAGLLLGAWLLPAWPGAVAALAGGVLGVVGQIGDLAESAIKRALGAKDAGGVFPGHGGVLDRLDGLLFNVPAFYYLATWVGGRP